MNCLDKMMNKDIKQKKPFDATSKGSYKNILNNYEVVS